MTRMRVGLMTFAFAVVLGCWIPTALQGQTLDIRWRGFSIPDPNDRLSLAFFLGNTSVVEALDLTVEQKQSIENYLKENGGDFTSKTFTMRGGQRPTITEVRAALAEQQKKSELFLEEVVTPNQWARLRQLIFQIEVHRVGLGGALANGKLGEDIGVHEQQRERLQRRASEIEARVTAEIQKLLNEAQHEMLQELTAEQRRKAEDSLGEPFLFREEVRRSPLPPGNQLREMSKRLDGPNQLGESNKLTDKD